jgi:integrase
VTVNVRRSKTDQTGAGFAKPIRLDPDPNVCAVRALRAWITAAGHTSGPLFRTFTMSGELQARRIAGEDVARLVRRLTQAHRIDGDFAAHSLRAGYITSAAQGRRTTAEISQISGHRDPKTVAGYIRRATPSEGVVPVSFLG